MKKVTQFVIYISALALPSGGTANERGVSGV